MNGLLFSNDPQSTEVWDPEPQVVTPGSGLMAPSDAFILFNGKDLDQWISVQDPKDPVSWHLGADGTLTVEGNTGDIHTKRVFDDIQMHLEWMSPKEVRGHGQDRGNSGLFIQNRYEIQILDSYQNRTYANGQAGSLYKQASPLVNASLPPGQWQTFDIIFTAPRFSPAGELESHGRLTLLHNGVLIHNNLKILGTTEYIGRPKVVPHGKDVIKLQNHGSPVSFRNIWVREL